MVFAKYLNPPSILLMAGMLFPSAAFPQAAVEYGMAASKSTATVSSASAQIRSTARSIPRQPVARGRLVIPGPDIKNMETVMTENRQKLEAESKAGGGLVVVESKPAKATVSVDGHPVGISPLEIKLPEGKHLVELDHPRYDLWQMEVTVSSNESTVVTAPLEKKYKSSVTISFQ